MTRRPATSNFSAFEHLILTPKGAPGHNLRVRPRVMAFCGCPTFTARVVLIFSQQPERAQASGRQVEFCGFL